MAIYFIRHTTVDCPRGICYGSTDLDVTENFVYEKERIQQQIKDIVFDKVYASPLFRCRKLAEALFLEREIEFDSRLKEMDFGQWEMKSWDAIFETPEGKYWMDHFFDTSCPGGESFLGLQQRVDAFHKKIEPLDNQNIAIVTHNGVIRVFKSLLLHIPVNDVFKDKGLEYGGIARFHDKWEEL